MQAPVALLVTGPTLRHVIRMTAAGTVGLIAVFAVEALGLFYIALLGRPELTAAMGYAGTVLFFATSISIGLSIAATALTARALGRGERQQAKQLAGASLLLMVSAMGVLACVAYPLLRPMLGLLGATGQTAELALSFMHIILPSWPLLGAGMCLSGLLRALGDARRSMFVTLGSAATSVLLDPLMIFGFGLGLTGAGISAVLTRAVMVAFGLYGLLRVHRLIAWPGLEFMRREFKPFIAIGLPAVLTQIATPVGNAYVTGTVAAFGDDAVAAWAVIQRIIPVAFGMLFALSGAIGPIIGQNYGAARLDRVMSTLRDSLKVTLLYATVVWALLAASGGLLADLFRATPTAHELIVFFCVFVAGSFVFNGALFVANAAFNNLGFAFYSTALNWGRSTLGVIPFVWLGQHWYGAKGAIAGYGIGVVLFGVFACLLCFRVVARLQLRVGSARVPA